MLDLIYQSCCIIVVFIPFFSADPLSNVDDSVRCHHEKVTAALCGSMCEGVCATVLTLNINTDSEGGMRGNRIAQEEEDLSMTHMWVDVFSSCYTYGQNETRNSVYSGHPDFLYVWLLLDVVKISTFCPVMYCNI